MSESQDWPTARQFLDTLRNAGIFEENKLSEMVGSDIEDLQTEKEDWLATHQFPYMIRDAGGTNKLIGRAMENAKTEKAGRKAPQRSIQEDISWIDERDSVFLCVNIDQLLRAQYSKYGYPGEGLFSKIRRRFGPLVPSADGRQAEYQRYWFEQMLSTCPLNLEDFVKVVFTSQSSREKHLAAMLQKALIARDEAKKDQIKEAIRAVASDGHVSLNPIVSVAMLPRYYDMALMVYRSKNHGRSNKMALNSSDDENPFADENASPIVEPSTTKSEAVDSESDEEHPIRTDIPRVITGTSSHQERLVISLLNLRCLSRRVLAQITQPEDGKVKEALIDWLRWEMSDGLPPHIEKTISANITEDELKNLINQEGAVRRAQRQALPGAEALKGLPLFQKLYPYCLSCGFWYDLTYLLPQAIGKGVQMCDPLYPFQGAFEFQINRKELCETCKLGAYCKRVGEVVTRFALHGPHDVDDKTRNRILDRMLRLGHIRTMTCSELKIREVEREECSPEKEEEEVLTDRRRP